MEGSKESYEITNRKYITVSVQEIPKKEIVGHNHYNCILLMDKNQLTKYLDKKVTPKALDFSI